jgi:two-component system, sensor histidine kinase
VISNSAPSDDPASTSPLDEMSDLKTQFLGSLNYEMRTPLNGILGMLDLLLETNLDSEQKEYAEISHICAENLLAIMNATLEYSALAANQVTLDEGDFHLREVLTSTLDEFSAKARAKGLSFIRSLDVDTLPEVVVGDAFRTKRLLDSLVDNAVKFTARGEVEVSASAKLLPGMALILLSVRDTGIGIPQHKLEAIFDSFRQLDTGLTRRYTGMGLGLAVAQKIARLMNAEVNVVSEVGAGSTFSLVVPMRLPREKPAGILRVLLIEDLSIHTLGIRAIDERPLEIDRVGSGPEGVLTASRNHYDLILVDLQAPGANPAATADRIHGLPGYSSVPVLALTAESLGEHDRLCADLGMQGTLVKPVQSTDLFRTLDGLDSALRRPNGIAV